MDKLILRLLQFICVVLVPAALAWAFMSYHKYSFFGVVAGSAMAIFLFLAMLPSKDK